MHIPDGFLSARVAAGYSVLSISGVTLACRRVRVRSGGGRRALLGVSSAFVFAAQMVNFPVAAGTSGHLLGGTLAAALLGLPEALIVMTSVLFVQCFVFGDGGVFALGANVFNMALVSCVAGFCCYRLLCGRTPSPTRRVACLAFAAWCATLAAAASGAEQLALSGTVHLALVLPAMLGVHAVIGVGEALITALVVASVLRFRPELLEMPGDLERRATRSARPAQYGLGLALVVSALLAPLGYAAPDGLSRVAEQLGFLGRGRSLLAALLPGYGVPGLGSGLLPTALAGSVGTLFVFGLCWLFALGLVPRSLARPDQSRASVEPESSR